MKQPVENRTKDFRFDNMHGEVVEGKLENLPLELIQGILAEIPDIQSLVCAVLTGPRLYLAFKLIETQITEKILLQQIHPELLHDALAADVSSRKEGPWTEDQALDFIAQYVARDQWPFHSSLRWKHSQALRLARLYDHVNFFLVDLTSKVLTGKQDLSRNERNRISRNLYRFQTYCHLFGDRNSPPFDSDVSQQRKYFARFAPWENDYLFEILDSGMIYSSFTLRSSLTKLNSITGGGRE